VEFDVWFSLHISFPHFLTICKQVVTGLVGKVGIARDFRDYDHLIHPINVRKPIKFPA
jgi:hypothetical protein